ncbi:HNH endonuclease signature motif containing protein, partial [Corynebacterium callunae]|uniref:HNH endonuclease signature motif containing protein n=1 Tax=Corynebacterium callunae TaxID=1721 RepID=UPI001FFF5FDE
VMAELAHAGTRVGSAKTTDYLVERLGVSRVEAFNRVALGKSLFPQDKPAVVEALPVVDAEAEVADGDAPAVSVPEVDVVAEVIGSNRSGSVVVSPDRLVVINRELDRLSGVAVDSREVLFAQAVSQAKWRGVDDLGLWVRDQVVKANGIAPDPVAAMAHRYVAFAKADADGLVRISGLVPSSTAALMKAACAPLSTKGSLVGGDVELDGRSAGQRLADAVHYVFERFHQGFTVKGRRGIGSIVVSMTTDDVELVEKRGLGHRYPTNTGFGLTLGEVLLLGAAKYDFGVVLDGESGRALHLGRMSRSASLEQKVALLASELVCSAPGCSRALIDCEIHHVDPWVRGGLTDVVNLTPQCFGDHPRNDDSRGGVNGKGFMVRDEVTGRVGRRVVGGGVVFNDGVAAGLSGGAWARAKHQKLREGDLPDPPDPPGMPDVPDPPDPPGGGQLGLFG